MKIFEIIDDESKSEIGVLLYFEKKKEFIIELREDLDEWTAPLLFTKLVKNKVFTVPRDLAYLWVKERIIPSGRQNISDILKTHKMQSYDEMKFLEISRGRCSQDSMYIKRVYELPEYILERRKKLVTECVVCENHVLLCFFADGAVKKIELEHLKDVNDISKVLRNEKLYQSCQVGTGGYSVTFNDSIDIPASVLYEKGMSIPLSRNDFLCFARNNILDTTESCVLLECSRQNLAYMVKQEQLVPVKNDMKGNLYLKGDVIKNEW